MSRLGVELSAPQQAFVALVIVAAPLVSLALYWTRARETAAVILAVSMLGALFFGLYYHFVEISPDHVSHLPEGAAQPLFIITALLLVPAEALAAAFGVWSWWAIRKKPV